MSALEEYNDWNLHDFLHNMTEQEKGDRKWVPLDVADAMRDELLARIEQLSKENRQQRIDWMERMNAIELERQGDEATNHALMRAKFNSYNELRKRADDAEQELAEAKAEVERLEAKDREHYECWKKDMAAWKADRERADEAEAALANSRACVEAEQKARIAAEVNYTEASLKLAAAEQKWLDMEDDYIQTAGKLAAAEATIERLKCCGNCEHWSSSLYECEIKGHPRGGDCNCFDHCHFTPSRWAHWNAGTTWTPTDRTIR